LQNGGERAIVEGSERVNESFTLPSLRGKFKQHTDRAIIQYDK